MHGKAYAGVLKSPGRGVIEFALTKRYAELADDEQETLEFMLEASGQPVTWLSLNNLEEKPGAIEAILDRIAPLIRGGAMTQILRNGEAVKPVPTSSRMHVSQL